MLAEEARLDGMPNHIFSKGESSYGASDIELLSTGEAHCSPSPERHQTVSRFSHSTLHVTLCVCADLQYLPSPKSNTPQEVSWEWLM
jgi:hypothetical protein